MSSTRQVFQAFFLTPISNLRYLYFMSRQRDDHRFCKRTSFPPCQVLLLKSIMDLGTDGDRTYCFVPYGSEECIFFPKGALRNYLEYVGTEAHFPCAVPNINALLISPPCQRELHKFKSIWPPIYSRHHPYVEAFSGNPRWVQGQPH